MISSFRLSISRARNLSRFICRFFIGGRRGHYGGLISGFMSIMVSFRVRAGARASPCRRLSFFTIARRLGN